MDDLFSSKDFLNNSHALFQSNIERDFMKQLKQENILVSIYLKNGIQLKGFIESFDDVMIKLKSEQTFIIVYKHAISTVMPTTKSAPRN